MNVRNTDVISIVCVRRPQQLDNTAYAGGCAALRFVHEIITRCRCRQQVRDDVTHVLRRTVRRQRYLIRDECLIIILMIKNRTYKATITTENK